MTEEETHQEKLHLECKHCGNNFPSQKDLDDHTIQFHIFVYRICYKVFKDSTKLDVHMDRIHDLTPRRLPAKHLEDKCLVREWKEWMEREERAKWRCEEDQKAQEHWEDIWEDYIAEKSFQSYAEEVDRRDRKRKREETKEEEEKAAGDDKEKDPD